MDSFRPDMAGFTDVDGNVRNGNYSVNVNLTSASTGGG